MTHIELPKGHTMVNTWHDEVYELPFVVHNIENALDSFLYTTDTAVGRFNPRTSISMRMVNKNFGFYFQIDKVTMHTI
jgi:hypothetical protein